LRFVDREAAAVAEIGVVRLVFLGIAEHVKARVQGLAFSLALMVEVQLRDHDRQVGAEALTLGEGLEVGSEPGELGMVGADVTRSRAQYLRRDGGSRVQLIGDLGAPFRFLPAVGPAAILRADRFRAAGQLLGAAQLVIARAPRRARPSSRVKLVGPLAPFGLHRRVEVAAPEARDFRDPRSRHALALVSPKHEIDDPGRPFRRILRRRIGDDLDALDVAAVKSPKKGLRVGEVRASVDEDPDVSAAQQADVLLGRDRHRRQAAQQLDRVLLLRMRRLLHAIGPPVDLERLVRPPASDLDDVLLASGWRLLDSGRQERGHQQLPSPAKYQPVRKVERQKIRRSSAAAEQQLTHGLTEKRQPTRALKLRPLRVSGRAAGRRQQVGVLDKPVIMPGQLGMGPGSVRIGRRFGERALLTRSAAVILDIV
jgi:hypothetical protein